MGYDIRVKCPKGHHVTTIRVTPAGVTWATGLTVEPNPHQAGEVLMGPEYTPAEGIAELTDNACKRVWSLDAARLDVRRMARTVSVHDLRPTIT